MFLYENLFFFNIFCYFNPSHAHWNQRRLFSGNLPGMFVIAEWISHWSFVGFIRLSKTSIDFWVLSIKALVTVWFLMVFYSRTAIAEAIIGLLLVFLRLEEEHWFSLVFFLQEVDLFTRHFDLKTKVRKAVLVNRFSLSERSFLIMRCV